MQEALIMLAQLLFMPFKEDGSMNEIAIMTYYTVILSVIIYKYESNRGE